MIIGCAAWLLAAAAFASSDARVIDRVAAVVGGDIILLSEVLTDAAPALAEVEKAAAQGAGLMVERRRREIVLQALQKIIDDRLVEIEARQMQIKVTVDEVDRAISNMARENGVDEETFRRALAAQGMDLLTYRSTLRSQLLRFKVLNLRVRGRVKISDEEARQYYNDQVRDVRATGPFEGAHILVRTPPAARAAEVASARRRAEEIRDLLDGGEDFAALARNVSEDAATAPHGGSLGLREPGSIPQLLDRAFLDLEVGELAGPIRTRAGFHVLRLNDRQGLDVQPFSEVRQRIVNQLTQEEMVRQEKIWLKELRLRTFIDIRL